MEAQSKPLSSCLGPQKGLNAELPDGKSKAEDNMVVQEMKEHMATARRDEDLAGVACMVEQMLRLEEPETVSLNPTRSALSIDPTCYSQDARSQKVGSNVEENPAPASTAPEDPAMTGTLIFLFLVWILLLLLMGLLCLTKLITSSVFFILNHVVEICLILTAVWALFTVEISMAFGC
ncbi:hypothetical protein VTK56DRAFT_577 [Thermocarpiscus australiensis]